MAEVLITRQFKQEFENCLRLNPDEVKIVVPYFGTTPFGDIIRFAYNLMRRGRKLHLITRPPGTRNNDISLDQAQLLARMNVNLRICHQPFLHAKIYQFCFPRGVCRGFVGSANFSKGGFESNYEMVAFFKSKCENDLIASQIKFLSSNCSPYIRTPIRQKS